MGNVADLEKLAELKEKGVISALEFEEQKKALLQSNLMAASTGTQKNRIVYILLAFFLGCFGIHNFYAGYIGRGIAQLLITVFLFWLIIPLLIVWVWTVVEMFIIDKDAKGVKFN